MPLLEVKDLRTYFHLDEGVVRAVDGVSFSIDKRETFGLAGESGCGKSVTAYSILKLLPMPPARIESGNILFSGKDMTSLSPEELRQVRGSKIAMIFQEPMTSLNPVMKIGDQIMEPLFVHDSSMNRKSARDRARELLDKVGIPFPDRRLDNYPFELSGGMKQRAVIAMALACGPDLLIADEPTTALDVTIQAQIIDLLQDLQDEFHMSILLITHNLGIMAQVSHRISIMYAGKIIEFGPKAAVITHPMHPYTQGLLQAVPDITRETRRLHSIQGSVPSFLDLPKGCKFAPRCPHRMKVCDEREPPMIETGPGNANACFLYGGV
jgi:peptide/nickel transport system ATP-binding protein